MTWTRLLCAIEFAVCGVSRCVEIAAVTGVCFGTVSLLFAEDDAYLSRSLH